MADDKVKSADAATLLMLEKAAADGVRTVFDRAEDLKPCPIGGEGSCCKMCSMGPCRLPAPRRKAETPEEHASRCGVCGASVETVAARNFARMIAAGTAAHSDHGRAVAQTFLETAKGEVPGYEIKDEQKLLQIALDFGVEVKGRSVRDIAVDVGEKAVAEFGRQSGALLFTKRAPLKRQKIWEEMGVTPRGVDREVVEVMHRTAMGVDLDYENIMKQAARCALADGWGGSMIATELQDILFGTPVPIAGKANLGVLDAEQVNIVVHGHEPLLSEMIVIASQDKDLVGLAKSKGAKGINISGICCTANEVLMRHGIPLAGNMLQQELAIVSGVVEAMVVDVQCLMQSLPDVAQCYHTEIITTSPKAKIPGATHIEFNEHDALNSAKTVVRRAIERFPMREKNGHADVPRMEMDLVAGFSHETINYLLGGMFRASYRPLNDNIINGRIRGIAGVVGCNNPRTTHDSAHIALVKELIKNDVIVLQTGCAAMACAKAGLMTPEAAALYAGSGLAEVCEAVGIPPVLHLGSCVDNTRILTVLTQMAQEGGLGDDISDIPAVGLAPEWMSEKALAIGVYAAASGAYVIFGIDSPVGASDEVVRVMTETWEKVLGGKMEFVTSDEEMLQKTLAHIDAKRAALGLPAYDPKKFGRSGDWRVLEVYERQEASAEALYGG